MLFSRTGPTGMSDSDHFFGTALAIEELNRSGGVLGRPIDVVAYDSASDPRIYRGHADTLLTKDGVSTIFGCHTSASRKAVLHSIERRNGLLWYPSLYEGFEYSPNVIYTGAVANQNSFPLSDYLVETFGKAFCFVGADYIYPRESNRIMRDLIESRGGEVRSETYLPMVASDRELGRAIGEIKQKTPDVVFSTLVGVTARKFYRMYHDAGFDPKRNPIASLTLAEGEVRDIGPELCEGHIMAATYFASIPTDQNRRFAEAFRARFGAQASVSMWSAGAYAQVWLFAKALEAAGSMDSQALVSAAVDVAFDAPEGAIRIDPETQHTWLTPRIGRIGGNGQFDIVWSAPEPVRPDPYLTASPIELRSLG